MVVWLEKAIESRGCRWFWNGGEGDRRWSMKVTDENGDDGGGGWRTENGIGG